MNYQTFIMYDTEKGDPVKPYMDVYKAKIQSNESLDKLKATVVVRQDFQNKEMIGDSFYPTAPMSNLKYFLSDSSKHKARVNQLYFIEAFI